ncbi:MAG: Gfo/Idh/MocA family oxidoreductase [Planctomycetaceae bacterium]|nr:Gfo/Idh/MocA family oxidoreductase [Planctomycetaceae bacterium]
MNGAGKVRYAVAGLGHIAQTAILPAFAHASENSELAVLVSNDEAKRRELGDRYAVSNVYSYADYDRMLHSGLVDAVYIALPNHMHCQYAVRAAEAGRHVLCEKPMALTEVECQRMLAAAEANDVRLMIAYRLHFEEANLKAVELVRSGAIGPPRLFASVFCRQVRPGDIRLQRGAGGGSVYDMGIYCVNAARYLFQDEPIEVAATSAAGADPRFEEVDEMVTATMRFSGDRLAVFACSLGAAEVSSYRIVGTVGDLRVEPAYDYVGERTHHLTVGGETRQEIFAWRDQFAAEISYFSRCVQEGGEPEPSGHEGLADVRIIEAIYRSATDGIAVPIEPLQKRQRPAMSQEMRYPRVEEPELVHVRGPME